MIVIVCVKKSKVSSYFLSYRYLQIFKKGNSLSESLCSLVVPKFSGVMILARDLARAIHGRVDPRV